ncbi:MAG: CopG family transcriptional regulator [Proteobacteria bacterium]|nr:CopG family transcriptional regulator [Pseudomonadota bacterium]
MNRTQIYLSDFEIKALDVLCHQTKRTRSSFIREALDFYLSHNNISEADDVFDKSFGCLVSIEKPDRQEWRERERRFF